MPRRGMQGKDSYELSEDEKDGKDAGLFGARLDGWMGGVHAANRDVYDPSETQRVKKGGSWAIIVRSLPSIEGNIDRHVSPGRVFYLEHDASADDVGFLPNGSYKVVLHSVWGDVWLFPYEYRVLSTELILKMWEAGELTFNPARIDMARLNEITFYARSRGIPLAVAAVMALGTVEGNIGWFECSDEVADYIEMCGRMGGPLTRVNHERRAAARARRKPVSTQKKSS
jgi:hypothetical protein